MSLAASAPTGLISVTFSLGWRGFLAAIGGLHGFATRYM
jgi:hypothetical protein